MLTRTPHMGTVEQAAATTARYRAAAEAGDVEGVLATCAPGARLNSPITTSTGFDGIDEWRSLLPHVFAVVENIRYTDDIGDAHTRALFYTATIGGVDVEEATRLKLDDQARITEATLWFRPLPGLTALTAALAPRLAPTPAKRRAVRALTAPMAAASRVGDKVAVKLVKPDAP
jgi:hypothetical protein